MRTRRIIEMYYPNPDLQFQKEKRYLHFDCASLFDTTFFTPLLIRQLKAGKNAAFSVPIYYYNGDEEKNANIEVQCIAIAVDTAPVTCCEYCGGEIDQGSKLTSFADRYYLIEKAAWKKWEISWDRKKYNEFRIKY